jgi:hypothetical protein
MSISTIGCPVCHNRLRHPIEVSLWSLDGAICIKQSNGDTTYMPHDGEYSEGDLGYMRQAAFLANYCGPSDFHCGIYFYPVP